MNRYLHCVILLAPILASKASAQSTSDLTRGDLNFFFAWVHFNPDGKWEFRLSNNVHGMLWRIITPHTDTTGTCEAGQVLYVSRDDHLEIKGDGYELWYGMLPESASTLRLTLHAEGNLSSKDEERSALLLPGTGGRAVLAHAED